MTSNAQEKYASAMTDSVDEHQDVKSVAEPAVKSENIAFNENCSESSAHPGLTPQMIERIRKRFEKIDKNCSGTIYEQEFLAVPNITRIPIATRLFAATDRDAGGDIDFDELIHGFRIFSNPDKSVEKLKFIFEIYDLDRDGFIGNAELFRVMKMMVGSNLTDIQLQQIVDRTIALADHDGDGRVSFPEFCDMVQDIDLTHAIPINSI